MATTQDSNGHAAQGCCQGAADSAVTSTALAHGGAGLAGAPVPSAWGAPVELYVAKEDFKFSAAHFVSHDGGRERLHGHNYRVSVWLRGHIGSDGYVMDFGEVKTHIRSLCRELDERFLCPMQSTSLDIAVTSLPQERRLTASSGSEAAAEAGSKCGSDCDCGSAGSGSVGTSSTGAAAAVVAGGSDSGSTLAPAPPLRQQLTVTVRRDGSFFSMPLDDAALLPIANTTVEEMAALLAHRLMVALGRERLAARRVTGITVGLAETPQQEARFSIALGQ